MPIYVMLAKWSDQGICSAEEWTDGSTPPKRR